VHKGLYAVGLEPGWNPSGAFFKLFTGASGAATRYKIDHLQQGRLIYLSINGEEGEDALNFRDYKTQDQWELKLDQKAVEKDGVTSSSFGIELVFTSAAGKKSSLKIGNPQIQRRNVLSYAMRQVIVAPDGKTVVILVERRERLGQATGLRYMVETFRLP
jgi:predicted secreted protein